MNNVALYTERDMWISPVEYKPMLERYSMSAY